MLLFTVLCLFRVTNVQGAVAPCADTTLDQLIALNATGCQSQDRIFSNFSYEGSDAPSAIAAKLIFYSLPNNQDIHGWSFKNLNARGAWINDFKLGFTISLAPGSPNVAIVMSQDQINTGSTSNGTWMSDTQSTATLVTNGLSTAAETTQVSYSPALSITTSSVATIPSGSVLIRYDKEFFEALRTGCPATIGFWKNQRKHPFPTSVQVSGLTIGGVHYPVADLLTILNANGGNAVVILGKQLVGALVNLAAGAMHNAAGDDAIAAAISLIQTNHLNLLTSDVGPSTAVGQALLAQEAILDGYNNAGFGTCSEGAGLATGQ